MPLLDHSYFELLFENLRDRRLGFIPTDGNVGDLMIHTATRQLLSAFSIPYHDVSSEELQSGRLRQPVDELIISGGGNMGSFWQVPLQQRQQALRLGLPITIFPQSFTRNDEDTQAYKEVFVRERVSQSYHSRFVLAPDTALGLEMPCVFSVAKFACGLFLREDRESRVSPHVLSLGDPVKLASSIEDYLSLASLFAHIVTDRLHFAIAGLMAGRQVTLLPNSYHKNRSMHETWLHDLGCRWQLNADNIKYDASSVRRRLWRRLAGDPACMLDWSGPAQLEEGGTFKPLLQKRKLCARYSSFDEFYRAEPQAWAAMFSQEISLEELVAQLLEYFPNDPVSIARQVQVKAILMHRDQNVSRGAHARLA